MWFASSGGKHRRASLLQSHHCDPSALTRVSHFAYFAHSFRLQKTLDSETLKNPNWTNCQMISSDLVKEVVNTFARTDR